MWKVYESGVFWVDTAWASILLILGSATLFRVLRGNRSWFGIVIASSALLWVVLMYGEELCSVIWRVQCYGAYGYGNYRWQYLIISLLNVADAHLLVFALKYFDEGITCSNVYTSEKGRKIGLAVVLVIYTVYFVACFGVYAYICYSQPVFRPPENASLDECKIQYYEWLDAYNKWNDDTRFALADPVSLA